MYTIIGIQKVDFKTRDGNVIKGTNLYVTYDKKYVDGIACERIFLNEDIEVSMLSVGDLVDFSYNKYGKVSGIIY